MKNLKYLLLTIGLLGLTGSGACNELSLARDSAIQLAYKNNRELRMATLAIERAAASFEWAGRLDNPQLQFSRSGDSFGLDDGETNYEVAFSQRFPLTAKLKKEKSWRRHEVILAEAEVAGQRRELAGEVDRAIINLLSVQEKIRLKAKLVALNNEIISFLKKQAEAGEASTLDVMQATLTGRTLEQETRSLEATRKQKRFALNKILGVDATTETHIDESLSLPGSMPATEADLKAILSRRPDHVLALAKINEADAAIAFEEANRWEDISVRVFVAGENAVDEPIGLERNTFAGFGFSIPLPLRNRNQEGIAKAQIDRKEASQGVEAAVFHIRSECEEAYLLRLEAWKLAREASGELLDLAEKNLAEFRKAYQQGQAGLTQVQRAQEQVLELQNASIEFTAAYHEAAARVRYTTGNYPGLGIHHSSK